MNINYMCFVPMMIAAALGGCDFVPSTAREYTSRSLCTLALLGTPLGADMVSAGSSHHRQGSLLHKSVERKRFLHQ